MQFHRSRTRFHVHPFLVCSISVLLIVMLAAAQERIQQVPTKPTPVPIQQGPIQVIAYHWGAKAGTENPAYLAVQLSNADGSPKVNAVLPGPKPNDPTSGLELKGSNWSFETILVPEEYDATGTEVIRPATFFDKGL